RESSSDSHFPHILPASNPTVESRAWRARAWAMRVSVAWEAWKHHCGNRPITPGGNALVNESRRRRWSVIEANVVTSIPHAKWVQPRDCQVGSVLTTYLLN